MTPSHLVLAALASSAVPGLDPVAVESVAGHAGRQFDVAFVQDTQDRRWVVRAPVGPAASAQMEQTISLLGLLARRLPFAVPAPRGFAPLKDGGRVMVYPYLAGRPIDLAALPTGPGLAAEIGRAVAQLHNTDLGLYEEAGVPAYDPESYRTRRLAELDRAAATGSVPSALLGRWEHALEDLALWRFAPTPTHGALTGRHILASFDDEQDAASGRVRALTSWEHAQVADPADDFAGLVAYASPAALDTVLEAYAHGRAERPDPHLRRRAQLASELAIVGGLLRALTGDQLELAQLHADRLRDLEARVADRFADPLTDDDRPTRAPATRVAGGPTLDALDRDGAEAADPDDEPGYDLEPAEPDTWTRERAVESERWPAGSSGAAEETEVIDLAALPGATATAGPTDEGDLDADPADRDLTHHNLDLGTSGGDPTGATGSGPTDADPTDNDPTEADATAPPPGRPA